jgi:hypothetical protein
MGNATLFWISILQDLFNGIIKISIWTSFNPSNLVSKLWDSKFSKVKMHLGNFRDYLSHSHTLPSHKGNTFGTNKCTCVAFACSKFFIKMFVSKLNANFTSI